MRLTVGAAGGVLAAIAAATATSRAGSTFFLVLRTPARWSTGGMSSRPRSRRRGSLAAGPLLLLLVATSWGQDTFAGDGVVLSDPSPSQDDAHAITIDGAFMYVAGMDTVPGNGQWRIEK